MIDSIIKNKEKSRFDGTSKHKSLTNLCINNVGVLFKSFDVQSRLGGIGKHTSLMNWKSDDFVGSNFFTEIPQPAHIILK